MKSHSRRTNLDEARMFVRFARGLRGFLREKIRSEDCPRLLVQAVRDREVNFLRLTRKAIYENPDSPYLRLLDHAGVGFADLEASIKEQGLERTLESLFDVGVFVTLDEFKGRKPIVRDGLEFPVQVEDFDNPFLIEHFRAQSGGSRGRPVRLSVDLDVVTQDAVAHEILIGAFGIQSQPLVLWRPIPPGGAGIKRAFAQLKLGRRVDAWFTQNSPSLSVESLKPFLFLKYVLAVCRLLRAPLPRPQFAPLSEVGRVVGWLQNRVREGNPVHLDTNVSSAMRVCLAAREINADIRGTFMRLGGEALTPAKAELARSLGVRAVCNYSMSEAGPIAMGCADPVAVDDVHLRTDKLALIQKELPRGPNRGQSAFFLTSLLPASSKILLNMANGDFGDVGPRGCGCAFGHLGLDTHVWNIRSYEKLTTEGMNFLGADLLVLIEEVLPKCIGGGPGDYQLVEQEVAGLTKVILMISPRVGPVDEERCSTVVLDFLKSRARENRMMSRYWAEAGTLQIERREPYATSSAKVLPLQVRSESK